MATSKQYIKNLMGIPQQLPQEENNKDLETYKNKLNWKKIIKFYERT